MQVITILSLALAAAGLASADRRPANLRRELPNNPASMPSHDNNSNMCSVGSPYCCNQNITDSASKKAFANLAALDNVEGFIGLDCVQVPVMGGALQNQCQSTPVCCTHVYQSGLINVGCNAIPIN